ncbi:MFS transporter, partial [Streptococcus anginosus]|nr:MFS transporter [Streptococcus anginosus]
RFNTAMSTYMIGLDLGLGAGPYILGLVKDGFLGAGVQSFRELFWIAAIIPVVCGILYFLKSSRQVETKTI